MLCSYNILCCFSFKIDFICSHAVNWNVFWWWFLYSWIITQVSANNLCKKIHIFHFVDHVNLFKDCDGLGSGCLVRTGYPLDLIHTHSTNLCMNKVNFSFWKGCCCSHFIHYRGLGPAQHRFQMSKSKFVINSYVVHERLFFSKGPI